MKPISTSTNVYPFSNYQSPSQGIFTTLNNAHGRPSGGSYIQTNGQNINKSQFNISGIRAGSGYMTHFLNNTYSNTLSTGGSLVISTNTTEIMGSPNYQSTSSSLQTNGYGAEFILFNKSLSNEDITLIQEYLNEKYNIY